MKNVYFCNHYSIKSFFKSASWVLLLVLGVCACKTTKRSTYLQSIKQDTTITGLVSNDFESKIQKGDQLSIMVTSLSAAEDDLFNKAAAVNAKENMSGFTVYPDGTVLLHRLGRVTVAGLTRRELAAKLEKDLLPFMKEPIVNVHFLNHKVTVIGAVGKSQVMNMPEEQMNIFEVLVNSGDVTTDALRDKVVIIREEDNIKTVKHVNLESDSIFSSPWYYIRPNDIILVNTDHEKAKKQENKDRVRNAITFVTAAVSFILLIIDRIWPQ